MTETTPYEVTGTAGEAELRRYPPMVLATVRDAGDDRGFGLLFSVHLREQPRPEHDPHDRAGDHVRADP